MITITIDNKQVEVAPGATILDAARKLGISIPTLCHVKGLPPSTSCMVCVVKIKGQEKYLPSCGALAVDGMELESDTDEVWETRRNAVELLLSEHAGDCRAPCQNSCPAGMDIPRMIRLIRDGRISDAIKTIKNDIALPATLGRICPAPCEKACRRKQHDAAVAVCLLKRFAADVDLAQSEPFQPECKPKQQKRAAIVGAGPAGLAAAYYLLREGIDCTLYDKNDKAGGALQYEVPETELPRTVLDAEITLIEAAGAEFKLGTYVTGSLLEKLQNEFDCVVIAAGKSEEEAGKELGIAPEKLKPNRRTYETSAPGLFLLPKAPQRLSIRALANGKEAARSVAGFLLTGKAAENKKPFNSRLGKLQEGELETFLKQATSDGRYEPASGDGFSEVEAHKEAHRCLHCDCRKLDTCRLKEVAEALQASPAAYRGERHPFEQLLQHADVIFEPGKCIACGVCIQITEQAGEELGLSFVNRGFDVRIGVPFDETLGKALEKTAAECVKNCPTGALSFKE